MSLKLTGRARSRPICGAVAVAACSVFGALSAQGAIIDTMDTTANFHAPFNGETATANGDGTVTILRTQPNIDAGINWQPGGVNIPIPTNEELTVTPTAAVNGGFWVPTILLFTSTGSFIGEKAWLGDTNTTQPKTLDIPSFATANGVNNAGQYLVRFRMDPFAGTNVGFTFTQIETAAAVPEPASLGILGFGSLLVLARRRDRA